MEKAEGWDGIPAEMIQVLGENGRAAIAELCRSMYKKGNGQMTFLKAL